ncbi:MAG: SAM-dependent methyltransferase, partial [Rugosibacter sp.]|nr:SAM-dependent methyltransferase [Rugosibacter sp.]
MRNHDQIIAEQFGSTAAAYLTSAVHAQGADLQDLAAYAQ